MVFIGGWRSRRPRNRPPYGGYGGYGPGYGRGYGRGYGYGGYGGGSSCMRDMFLVEGGCCLAELLGCAPQLLLIAPATLRRAPSPRPSQLSHPAHAWPPCNDASHRPGRSTQRTMRQRITAFLIALIQRYQAEISPKRGPSCHFTPTCSHYALEAYERHGLWRGSWLTVRRLGRCRPGGARGHDPVPVPMGTDSSC
jgi:putative membrane protein insertion efficiency factor